MKRVIKLGGRAQAAAELPSLIANAWNNNPGSLCIVHGGGDEISALQRVFGSEPKFSGGRRITTEEDLSVIRMALSGVINKRLVSTFVAAGTQAVGISGEDAALISAKPLGVSEFGHVGMPNHINTTLIETLCSNGFMPVISPLGANSDDEKGAALNVNGDDAAAAIAVALKAGELVLVADVDGVLNEAGTLIQELTVEEGRELIASGVAVGGMAAKLEAAYAALSGGVARVRIASLNAVNDPGCGTTVTLVNMFAGAVAEGGNGR